MTGAARGIVVGYDGSTGSQQALDWAAAEADRCGMDLIVCHACAPGFPWPGEGADADPGRRYGEQVLAEGLARAQATIGSGHVRGLLAPDQPARALCEQSGTAAMIVVGCRGRGGLAGLLLGSVSLQVAAHAAGPVTVVRGNWQPVPGHLPPPVVVGNDGSPLSDAAVAFAFEQAARRDVPLLAVCALADAAGVLGIAHHLESEADAVIKRCQQAYPEVTVRQRVEQGSPRDALLQAAADAQLLVVGARGRGGIRGMTLGSVTLALLHHAGCPVTVIRPS